MASVDTDQIMSGRDGKVAVSFHDTVAVVTIDCGQNRWNKLFVKRMNEALDQVLANERAQVMITTGVGKFYSYGLDLDWLLALGKSPQKTDELVESMHGITTLASRILSFPIPTVAAINGHAYAMGAIASLCHDYRIMQTGRGWWCTNEVHIGLPLGGGFARIIRNKVSVPTYHECATLGRRYTGDEALESQIVNRVSSPDSLLKNAIKLAKEILPKGGYKREYLGMMKEGVYAETINLLTDIKYAKIAVRNFSKPAGKL